MFQYSEFSKGWKDYFSNISLVNCPFKINSAAWRNWRDGWMAAFRVGN